MPSQNAPRVGIVRDDRYLLHKPGHTHPEHPNRLKAVYRMLDADFSGELVPIEAQPATLEHLELVHTPAYVKRVLKTAEGASRPWTGSWTGLQTSPSAWFGPPAIMPLRIGPVDFACSTILGSRPGMPCGNTA